MDTLGGVAFMLSKLELEIFLSIRYAFQGCHGNPKLPIAERADGNSRRGSQPLQNSEVAFRHDLGRGDLAHRLFDLRNPVGTFQHFPRLGTIRGTHDSILLHKIDQVCGAAITNAQSALQQRSGRFSKLYH